MKLDEYLKYIHKKPKDAVIEAGFKYVTFMKWLNSERIPRAENISKIVNWSNGLVTPLDFYEQSIKSKKPEE